MIHDTLYGNTWQEMGKDRIQYMTCTIQNDTNHDFTVISVQTKPPYSSPYKGIVRGIQPTTQLPGGTQISFQMGDKRARHWFSAVLEIVFRCTSSSSGNWYMHMFWYPTESGLHVAFSEHPQFSWSHLSDVGVMNKPLLAVYEGSRVLNVRTSVDNQLKGKSPLFIEFDITGFFNVNVQRNELQVVKVTLKEVV